MYPFASLGMNQKFHPTLNNGCDYFSLLKFKFYRLVKGDMDVGGGGGDGGGGGWGV